MLRGKCVVLGVTGGIAAYKAAALASLLTKNGAKVRCVLTRHACEFITPMTFAAVTGQEAMVDEFAPRRDIAHISLAKEADLFLVAPATADILAKFAAGVADDLLTSAFLANPAPVLLAPAMNANMWRHPATQANVSLLASRGVRFVGPESGHLACGDADIGRMSEPDVIFETAKALLLPKRDMEGVRVLVTAGPTRESLDPVRFITNHSSGKMGYAIAQAARDRGADVTLVSGPVNLPAPDGVKLVPIQTTVDLYDAVTTAAKGADVVIQAAAPADFRPETVSATKIKKTGGDMTIHLVPNPDVAAQLGRDKRPGQILVAFAAETDHMVENARGKRLKKNADMVVANDVTAPGAGFGVDTNIITLITAQGETALPMMTKREAADAILDGVMSLRI